MGAIGAQIDYRYIDVIDTALLNSGIGITDDLPSAGKSLADVVNNMRHAAIHEKNITITRGGAKVVYTIYYDEKETIAICTGGMRSKEARQLSADFINIVSSECKSH